MASNVAPFVDLSSVALLVIDMQPLLLRVVKEPKRLLQRCRFAIEVASLLNIRTAFTEQCPEKLQPTLSSLRSLAPQAPIFSKTSFSALQAQGLKTFLETHKIEHLLLVGLETAICIYLTALQAHRDGLTVTLLHDCIEGRRPQDAPPALQALRQAGVHLLAAETVFYSILADARHPHFNAFNRLVKSTPKHYGSNTDNPY